MASLQQSSVQDRRPQPGLALNLTSNNSNLASNNPFRRNISPAPPSSGSFIQSPPVTEDRRKSTNPFLDSYRADAPAPPMPARRSPSPHKAPNGVSFDQESKQKDQGVSEVLIDLSLTDKPTSDRNIQGRPPRHGPPQMNPAHRTTHSNEEKRDTKAAEKAALDIFESPKKSENRRPMPRRNSDSSMFDGKDEDRRRRERRRKEREARGKDGKPRSSRTRRPQGLDIIDKLDVTGLYGPGLIHHDGPFDACNPHRNRRGRGAAPMEAFPAGSLNNALGGSGPVNQALDYDAFHGRTVEGFADYNETSQPEVTHHAKKLSRPRTGPDNRTTSWDAKEKIEPVHGEASAALGTSTFIEGSAVPRKDITRRESESENAPLNPGGGLSRKRSIAQKIKGISQRRPGVGDSAGVTSPEARYVQSPGSPPYANGVQSAGGRGRMYERNPFFEDQGDTKKITTNPNTAFNSTVTATAVGRPRTASSPRRNRERAPSSPKHNLLRSPTQESGNGNGNGVGTGIIGRVKSLRSKKRPERFGAANS